LQAGWPDWAYFRLLGDCLLWAVTKITKVHREKVSATFFRGKSYVLILQKNVLVLRFW
jgi:hypothetical protein